jgi:hypothetical protein
VDVRIQGVKHPQPGVVVYEGVEIADPETNHGLMRCRQLVVATATPPSGQTRPVLVLRPSQTEINATEMQRIGWLLQRLIEDGHSRLAYDWKLDAADVTLCGAESQTFTDVKGSLETRPNQTSAALRFQIAGSESSTPIELQMVRNRDISPPATGFAFDTGGDALPCNVLAMGLSELKSLGERSSFRGKLWVNVLQDGWEGEIAGQLFDIDLDQLVSEHLPHRLTGLADLTIQSAKFRHGRLEEAFVMLSGGPGMIDRSLIAAAVPHLGLTPTEELKNIGERIPFEQLAFSLTLDGQGIKIQGGCRDPKTDHIEPKTILANARGRMLGEPLQQPRPLAALVRTLVPESTLQVSASSQSDWLLARLPVPQVMPAAETERTSQHLPTHLLKPSQQ